MAYEKYVTDAIVLGSMPRGEADRVLILYTRVFGLAYAQAKGVRTERSRMRYALPNLARSTVSLVRGKGGWRLAGASAYRGVHETSAESRAALARIAHLTQRLVAGEERNDALFDTIAAAHYALCLDECTDVHAPEMLCVARILFTLGYLAPDESDAALFAGTSYEPEKLAYMTENKDRFLRLINEAITETHL